MAEMLELYMQEQMDKERKENSKKQPKRHARDKTTLSKMKTVFVRLISKLSITKARISELSQRKR